MKNLAAAIVSMFFYIGFVVWVSTPFSEMEWYHYLMGVPCAYVVIDATFDWVKVRLK